eukprot:231706_1
MTSTTNNHCLEQDIDCKLFKYDTALIIIWVSLFIICFNILSLSIMWIWLNRNHKVIKVLSPKISTIFTVGLIFLCIGAVLYIFHPLTNSGCILYFFCYGIGAYLAIMSQLLKTYRLYKIFKNAQMLKRAIITEKRLMLYLLIGLIIEILICVLYAIFHQNNGGIEYIYWEKYNRLEYVCNQSNAAQYIKLINFILIGILMIILCYFAFASRTAPAQYRESRCIYFVSFFAFFTFVTVVIVNFIVNDIFIVITIQSGGILMVIGVIWVLFYGVRMYRFYKESNHIDRPEDRSTRIGRTRPLRTIAPLTTTN